MVNILINQREELDYLKSEIAAARRNLEQAWESSGDTNPAVLAAGEIFDRLMNKYERLAKESLTLISGHS